MSLSPFLIERAKLQRFWLRTIAIGFLLAVAVILPFYGWTHRPPREPIDDKTTDQIAIEEIDKRLREYEQKALDDRSKKKTGGDHNGPER